MPDKPPRVKPRPPKDLTLAKKKNPATDATILYLDDPEGGTRRSILLTILKKLRFDLRVLQSWSGDETTFISAILQWLQDYLRFWLFWMGVGMILDFENSKKSQKTKLSFMDGFGWFFDSISLRGCRCEISGQRTPARPAVKIWTLKHLVWVERGKWRAGRVTLGDASRQAQQCPLRHRKNRQYRQSR